MRITYLGTAMVLLEIGDKRILTDPALDPAGTKYDFGPWYVPASWFASEKTYTTPMDEAALGTLDAVLVSHDHHADNLDTAGKKLLESPNVKRIITTVPGAKRLNLGARVTPLAWGASTDLEGIKITATPARHGPHGTPKIHQVIGFLIEPPAPEPVVWLSGDTVLFPALEAALAPYRGKVDVAVVHCGGVRFPKLPILGKRLFTFDSAQAVATCKQLDPRVIIPVHRDGWPHFREPANNFRTAFEADFGERMRWLELGESASF